MWTLTTKCSAGKPCLYKVDHISAQVVNAIYSRGEVRIETHSSRPCAEKHGRRVRIHKRFRLLSSLHVISIMIAFFANFSLSTRINENITLLFMFSRIGPRICCSNFSSESGARERSLRLRRSRAPESR